MTTISTLFVSIATLKFSKTKAESNPLFNLSNVFLQRFIKDVFFLISLCSEIKVIALFTNEICVEFLEATDAFEITETALECLAILLSFSWFVTILGSAVGTSDEVSASVTSSPLLSSLRFSLSCSEIFGVSTPLLRLVSGVSFFTTSPFSFGG